MFCSCLPPSQRTVIFYDVFVNGKRHRFSEFDDARNFAVRVGSNVFRSEETLEWSPNPDIDSDIFAIECYAHNVHPIFYATGDFDTIFKQLSDSLNDVNFKKLVIYKR